MKVAFLFYYGYYEGFPTQVIPQPTVEEDSGWYPIKRHALAGPQAIRTQSLLGRPRGIGHSTASVTAILISSRVDRVTSRGVSLAYTSPLRTASRANHLRAEGVSVSRVLSVVSQSRALIVAAEAQSFAEAVKFTSRGYLSRANVRVGHDEELEELLFLMEVA